MIIRKDTTKNTVWKLQMADFPIVWQSLPRLLICFIRPITPKGYVLLNKPASRAIGQMNQMKHTQSVFNVSSV